MGRQAEVPEMEGLGRVLQIREKLKLTPTVRLKAAQNSYVIGIRVQNGHDGDTRIG